MLRSSNAMKIPPQFLGSFVNDVVVRGTSTGRPEHKFVDFFILVVLK
jgi:hypothetical protein